jgi:RNA polymerase sigma factor (sigma-70 family)
LDDDGDKRGGVTTVADDGDFSAYLVARWPCLVRSLVLLGSSYAEAQVVARDSLARCQASWEHDRDTDDVDVQVYRTVLERLERLERLRRKGRASGVQEVPEPPLLVDPTIGDPERRLALRNALADALAGLPPEERTVLVLRFVAELSEGQVADVLDVGLEEVRSRQADGLAGLDLVALRGVR